MSHKRKEDMDKPIQSYCLLFAKGSNVRSFLDMDVEKEEEKYSKSLVMAIWPNQLQKNYIDYKQHVLLKFGIVTWLDVPDDSENPKGATQI